MNRKKEVKARDMYLFKSLIYPWRTTINLYQNTVKIIDQKEKNHPAHHLRKGQEQADEKDHLQIQLMNQHQNQTKV